jgi:hypothetical protein
MGMGTSMIRRVGHVGVGGDAAPAGDLGGCVDARPVSVSRRRSAFILALPG